MIDEQFLKIRQASLSDIEVLVELLGELFSVEEDFPFDAALQRRGLGMMLSQTETRCVLVAESCSKVVGMCSAQVVISTAEGGPAGLVEDMVVRREWKGQGIGRKLLEALESWAEDKGLLRLQLLADRNNLSALKFYDKMGWTGTQLICLRKKSRWDREPIPQL